MNRSLIIIITGERKQVQRMMKGEINTVDNVKWYISFYYDKKIEIYNVKELLDPFSGNKQK